MTTTSVILDILWPTVLIHSEEGRRARAGVDRATDYINLAVTGGVGSVVKLGETTVLIHLEKGLPYLGGLTTILFDERLDYRIAYINDFTWTNYEAGAVAPAAFKLHVYKQPLF